MIKLALISLKKDYKQALFYWLTFVLSTAFTFSIFNLSFSDQKLLSIQGGSGSSMISAMLCGVITIAMFSSFYANNYYITTKAKELSLNLISGASYLQLTSFLMIQNIVIMFSSIPLGAFIGYISIPLQRYLLQEILHFPAMIVVSSDAILGTSYIVGFEVLWCVILNLGFVYRSSITDLLHTGKSSSFAFKHVGWDLLYMIFYSSGIVLILLNGDDISAYVGYTLLGSVGLFGIDAYIIPKLLSQLAKRCHPYPQARIYLNYIRDNFQKMNLPILILVISSSLMIALVASYYPALETMIALFCDGMILILIGFSLNFKYMGIIEQRLLDYHHLLLFGYTFKQLKRIALKEVLVFYGILFILSSTYGLLVLMKLYFLSLISYSLMNTLILMMVFTFITMMIITSFYYQYKIKKIL